MCFEGEEMHRTEKCIVWERECIVWEWERGGGKNVHNNGGGREEVNNVGGGGIECMVCYVGWCPVYPWVCVEECSVL